MSLSRKKSVEVKRIGPTLVAAFHDSSPSLIWKFDLERNHSFTLALQGEEGDFELGVTSPKGDFYPVARFMEREDADKAFTAVQAALMKRKYGWIQGGLSVLGGLVLVLLIALSIGAYGVSRGFWILSSASSQPVAVAPEIQNGVPMPADQVLRPPP